jgi:hypothetical protein
MGKKTENRKQKQRSVISSEVEINPQSGRYAHFCSCFKNQYRGRGRVRNVALLTHTVIVRHLASPQWQWQLHDLGGEKHILDRDPHGNGHGHVWVYARLCHIKRALQEPTAVREKLFR